MFSAQTKISIEIKISKNYNTVTLGIQDEPVCSADYNIFRDEIRRLSRLLVEEAELQLTLIGRPEKKE